MHSVLEEISALRAQWLCETQLGTKDPKEGPRESEGIRGNPRDHESLNEKRLAASGYHSTLAVTSHGGG